MGIGGSDIAAIMGLNQYVSRYDVWLEKTGQAAPKEETPKMRLGHFLEPFVAEEFAAASGFKVIAPRKGLVIHKKYPHFRASVDRLYTYPGGKKRMVLEIKTTSIDVDTDDPQMLPASWRLQAQWYCGVLGLDRCAIAFLPLLRGGVSWHEYDRDDEKVAEIQEMAHDFWHNHVCTNLPPKPVNMNDVLKMFPIHTPEKAVEADEKMARYLGRYKQLKAEIKAREEEAEQIRDVLVTTMGDAEIITFGDSVAASFRTAKTGRRFDTEMFKVKHPKLFKKYSTEVPGGRRFLVR